jgi:predicted Zn-dependent peptidase
LIHLDFPSKQTHLLIGQTGINRSHPDFYPLYLGNHIFGGMLAKYGFIKSNGGNTRG